MIQSRLKIKIVALALCGMGWVNAQSFTGKYSSEGDITAKGMMTMELTQSKSKIEGVANYKSNDGNLDTGLLSVNGYVKNGTAYIRLRDQRGNTLADGDVHFQGNSTLHFTQSTSTNQLPKSAYLFNSNGAASTVKPVAKPAPVNGNYAGKYSNEGDTTAKGILSFDLQQSGAKLEGTASYSTFDNSLSTRIVSVNGYVKNGVGYIRFRDSKGNAIGDGTLSKSGNNIVFNQTTAPNWLPKQAFLYR